MSCDQDEIIRQAIFDPVWKHRSDGDLAQHLGVSRSAVSRLRRTHNMKPEWVEIMKAGKPVIMKTGRIGSCRGKPKPLTRAQQALVDSYFPRAQSFARSNANEVMSYEDLISVASDALVLSARLFRCNKDKPMPRQKQWEAFAFFGISRAFKRSFSSARKKAIREKVLCDSSILAGDLAATGCGGGETIIGKFRSMRGLDRLVIEWIAGLDGGKARSVDDIAKFLAIEARDAELVVSKARRALEE